MLKLDTRYRYEEPDENQANRVVTMTVKEIIEQYYPHWRGRMLKVGKAKDINLENCVDDWVTVNWAQEVKDAEG